MAVNRPAPTMVSADTEVNNHTSSSSSSAVAATGLQDSPIFLQFLDGVHQLMHQFPSHFEFTPHLLTFLADAAYSAQYGTFICNADYERVMERVKLHTCSV
uniref:Myotubularin-related protein 4 n=1 Tax=Lygus hesperus TaxID=30085 RepID=A0A0A9ZG99_LYGHE